MESLACAGTACSKSRADGLVIPQWKRRTRQSLEGFDLFSGQRTLEFDAGNPAAW